MPAPKRDPQLWENSGTPAMGEMAHGQVVMSICRTVRLGEGGFCGSQGLCGGPGRDEGGDGEGCVAVSFARGRGPCVRSRDRLLVVACLIGRGVRVLSRSWCIASWLAVRVVGGWAWCSARWSESLRSLRGAVQVGGLRTCRARLRGRLPVWLSRGLSNLVCTRAMRIHARRACALLLGIACSRAR